MLESMINNPMPTRAEMTDVANAVWDGTDVVMLSGETSIGKYPVKTVKIMHDILASTEAEISNHSSINYEIPNDLVNNLFDSTGKAVVGMSNQINAAAIVVFTHYGRKAKVISKYRPRTLLIAMSDKFNSLNRLNLSWGIKPYFVENIDNEETAIKEATNILKRFSFINGGDVIMFTAGAPITDKERRSWVRFVVVE
jgi:pyruvate kinase